LSVNILLDSDNNDVSSYFRIVTNTSDPFEGSREIFVVDTNGSVTAKGVVRATGFDPPSSRALKKSITPLPATDEDALLAALESTDVVRYRYKTEPDARRLHVGVIAEEAPEEILSEDGKAVSLGDWSGVLTASVKALARWVHGLEADRDDLKAENERLRAQVEAMERRLEALEAASGRRP
jgi:hypothetical protein